MSSAVEHVKKLLRDNIDQKTKESAHRYFKENEKIVILGVPVSVMRKLARQVYATLEDSPKSEIFAACEKLWQSGIAEESFVACEWSYAVRERYAAVDFAVFRSWVERYVNNWASCDTLCNHSVGTVVEMYPQLASKLVAWTESDNRWMKRGAAVSLIIPARKGLFLEETFAIADALQDDSDDMVQKGYGWMLKAASEAHAQKVFAYVLDRKKTMPRTAFRYALEKMPKEWRAEAMKK